MWERRQALAEVVAQMSIPRTLTPVPVSRHHAVCVIRLKKFLAGAGGCAAVYVFTSAFNAANRKGGSERAPR